MTPTRHAMSVLAQITSWIPDRIIENLARKHRIQTRSFSATSHVISMVYVHLAHALSLNDICDSLSNHAGTLKQIRGCTPPSRNGLSHANKTRNADMAGELFWKVYESLSKQHPEFLSSSRDYPGFPHRFRTRTIRAVDSTTIQLTAFSMGWAKHRRQKAGEVVVFDKAYVDFKHLTPLASRGVSWVTRSKENMLYEVMGQQATAGEQKSSAGASAAAEPGGLEEPAAKDMGQQVSGRRRYVRKKCRILSDERFRLTGLNTREHYPEELRLVTAEVEIKGKMMQMTFITNNLEWSAFTICQLYQCRWGVEVFFKEIKQTLQLADFLGHDENAVRWQTWTALLTYLLLRSVAWHGKWRHPFSRLFTLVRAVPWNFFLLASLIECCDTVRERRKRAIRGSPETACQLTFW